MGAQRVLGELCMVCGARPAGRVEVSLLGEVTCASHPTAGRCVFCTRPHAEPRPAGWQPFSHSALRCPSCLVGAVETQADARRRLPTVRAEMAKIGISLQPRVLVRLVDPDGLAPSVRTSGVVLAVTEHRASPGQGREAVEIRVSAGLPPNHFGRAVAHEIGHAWLAQQGGPQPSPEIEEGLCELFAHAWLKLQRNHVTDEMRRQLRENPDLVYGDFRSVHAAIRTHGITTVLASLALDGTLPDLSELRY